MMILFVSLVLSPFILTGLWVTLCGLAEVWRAYRSGFWPRMAGTITRSEIKKEGTGEYEKISPDIEFSYRFSGSTFHSTLIRRGLPKPPGQVFADYFTTRYAVGQQVTIAYDPDDPLTAILEPGLYKHAFAPIALGLMFANSGMLFWLLIWTLDA